MSPAVVLEVVVGLLHEAGIDYMLTGSLAGAYHGIPRATRDVDLVIDPTEEGLARLVTLLEERDWYVSADAAREALEHRTQFNAIDRDSGWKIDLIIRRDRAFSREEFGRRREAHPLGFPIDVATAEDVVLAKLEWAKRTGSERQMEDAAGILSSQGERLDRGYVERWVRDLGLEEEWNAARVIADG